MVEPVSPFSLAGCGRACVAVLTAGCGRACVAVLTGWLW